MRFKLLLLVLVLTYASSVLAESWKVKSKDLVLVNSKKKIFCYRDIKNGKRYIGLKGRNSRFTPYPAKFQSVKSITKLLRRTSSDLYNLRLRALQSCLRHQFEFEQATPTPQPTITTTPSFTSTPTPSPTPSINLPPVARVRAATIEAIGVALRIDGADSFDPEQEQLRYEWTLLARPTTSQAVVSSASTQQLMFTADREGQYRIQLRVYDGIHFSAPTQLAFSAVKGFHVGPNYNYTRPSQVSSLVQDGDTVLIDAGIYVGDVARWTANGLKLLGLGGRAHLIANGQHYGGKAIWVISGNGTLVDSIEFSGAVVPDNNGAGIRQEGPNLIVKNSYFHDNQEGILANDNPTSQIIVQNSIFERNGYQDGRAHNIYVNHIGEFWLLFSDVSLAVVGHNVKSRAFKNYILYNRIIDQQNATASYEINLPNAGTSYIIGNIIQQGPATGNSTIISYAEEGATNPDHSLFIINNTIVNDRLAGGIFIRNSTATSARLINNFIVGPGTFVQGPAQQLGNVIRNNSSLAGFINAAAYDYRLSPSSPAINAGVDPGAGAGLPLTPTEQYIHPASSVTRAINQNLDAGAFELQ